MATNKKAATKYNIEMDIRAFVVFTLLLLVAAAIIFYLGIIFGKAMRDPMDVPISVNTEIEKEKSEKKQVDVKNLKIYDMKEDKKEISSLKKDFEDISSKSKVTLEFLKDSKKKDSSKTIQSGTTTAPTNTGNLFTVQVFATKNNQKAVDIINNLKRQNFDAYFEKVEVSESQEKMYLIRVGKVSKKEAENLKKKLSKTSTIKAMGTSLIIRKISE